MAGLRSARGPERPERRGYPPSVLITHPRVLIDRVPPELNMGPRSLFTLQHAMVIQAIARYRYWEATGVHVAQNWKRYPTHMAQTDSNLEPLPIPRALRAAGERLAAELLDI